MLTPPMVPANASAMTTEIDESQIQGDMQRKIGNKINCVSSISSKHQPLSNSSPNSFHWSLSCERLGFSMTAAPRVFYVGNDDIPIDPEPPDKDVVLTSPLPLVQFISNPLVRTPHLNHAASYAFLDDFHMRIIRFDYTPNLELPLVDLKSLK
ncbi:hypothetical protein A2U01_0049699, partial [Trifolium medium]|nr:hypothetical protein [Trifolium medium]